MKLIQLIQNFIEKSDNPKFENVLFKIVVIIGTIVLIYAYVKCFI